MLNQSRNQLSSNKLIIAAIIAILPNLTLAERWYEIEVILFEQATDERLAAENWDNPGELPILNNSRDFLTLAPHAKAVEQLCFAGANYSVKQLPVTELEPEIISDSDQELPEITDSELIIEPDSETGELEPELPYQLLDRSEHELTEVYQQLRRRRGYRMLFHQAWRQPTSRKRDTLPIRIYAGADYSDRFNYRGDALVDLDNDLSLNVNIDSLDFADIIMADDEDLEQIAPRFNQEQHIDGLLNLDQFFKLTKADYARQNLNDCAAVDNEILSQERQAVWQIDGNIMIYTDRFRHVETDLVVRIPATEEVDLRAIETNLAAEELLSSIDLNNTQSSFDWQYDENFLTAATDESNVTREVLKYYPLRQSRRIINDKIHYFDHPLMGMIIQLRRYDPDEESS